VKWTRLYLKDLHELERYHYLITQTSKHPSLVTPASPGLHFARRLEGVKCLRLQVLLG
jgi:hypothetical protein